jgi:hypothetical protein
MVPEKRYLPEPPPVTTTILPDSGKSPTTMVAVIAQLQKGALPLDLRTAGTWRM